MPFFPALRAALYGVLWVFSAVLLGLTAARLHYTTHLKRTDPLNKGRPFYDPIVAELTACAILGLIWAPLVIHMIHGRHGYRFLSRVWHELLGLIVLWVLWLVGAAMATHIWPNLPHICAQYHACRLLTAMLAFAWLGWLTLTALVFTTLMYATVNGTLVEPAHGYWVRDRDEASASGTPGGPGRNRMSEYRQSAFSART